MTPPSRAVAAVALATLVVLAGCGGGGGGDQEPIEATADAAAVGSEALSAAGYAETEATSQRLNTTVSVSMQGDVEIQATRDVNATLQVARYRRSTDAGPAALAVVSSPAVNPLDDQFDVSEDPLATLETAEVVNRAQDAYEVTGLQQVGETERVTVLGNGTRLAVYEATADGEPVTVYAGAVEHEGDFVHVVAVQPAGVDERSRVLELARAVEH